MAVETKTAATTWTIDPAHTSVEFSVKHMMFTTVRGRFTKVSGTILAAEGAPDDSHVEIAIEAASIDTGVADRDTHLRSADFLDVQPFPAITFASRRIEGAHATAGDRFKVIGDLTIRGTAIEVVLDAVFEGTGKDPWGNQKAGFSASTTIDRRQWGLTWNQALETGGLLVANTLKIDLEVQAVRAAG